MKSLLRLLCAFPLICISSLVGMFGAFYFATLKEYQLKVMTDYLVQLNKVGNLWIFALALVICGMYGIITSLSWAMGIKTSFEFKKKKPTKAQLEERLKIALDYENYALASKLRDELNRMN